MTNFNEMNRAALLDFAREFGIKNANRIKKDELAEKLTLLEAQAAERAAAEEREAQAAREKKEARAARVEARKNHDLFNMSYSMKGEDEDENNFVARVRKAAVWVDGLETALATFRDNMAHNPGYAMEWADSVYEATAKSEVGQMVLDAYRNGATLAELERELMEQTRYKSNSTSSTSQSANLMNLARVRALADMASGW